MHRCDCMVSSGSNFEFRNAIHTYDYIPPNHLQVVQRHRNSLVVPRYCLQMIWQNMAIMDLKKISRIKKTIHSEENHQHTSSLQINIQKLFFSLQQIMHLNWSRLQKHVCRMFLLFLCIVYLISETNSKNVIRIQCLNLLRLRESILLKLLKEK